MAVHIAWQSCLYVTNFPESFDKEAVEQLFSKVSSSHWRLSLIVALTSLLTLGIVSTAPSLTLVGHRSATSQLVASATSNSPLPFVLTRISTSPARTNLSRARTQASAQAALALHGTQLEGGFKLTVYISDPGRKKGRTDAGANEKELYVAGLSKFVKDTDLKKLFEPVSGMQCFLRRQEGELC